MKSSWRIKPRGEGPGVGINNGGDFTVQFETDFAVTEF